MLECFYFQAGNSIQSTNNVKFAGLISCDHNRAPLYYAESIYSKVGFYGIECSDYVSFRKGRCDKNDVVIMGEYTPSE